MEELFKILTDNPAVNRSQGRSRRKWERGVEPGPSESIDKTLPLSQMAGRQSY